MAFIDYYKILGVSKDIPQKELRAAYKRRAKQFHPDLHPDDPKAKAKFQALSEAYDVLSDPEKRRKYDQYGEHWQQAEAFGNGGAGFGDNFEGFDFSQFSGGSGFSDFFENLFGGRHAAHTAYRRSSGTLQAETILDMYTALLGGEIILSTGREKIKLRVKPGTQEGTKVRLRGKGNDRGDGTRGDLIITYRVQLPEHLNERQRELLRQMRDA